MGDDRLTTRDIVERLWADVRRREQTSEALHLPELPVVDQLAHAQPLRHVNQNWDLPRPSAPPAAGAFSSAKRRAKERLAQFVIALLDPYLAAERELNADTVRVLNALAHGHDRVSTEVREVAEAVRLETIRLTDEINLLHSLLEQRVEALEKLNTDAR